MNRLSRIFLACLPAVCMGGGLAGAERAVKSVEIGQYFWLDEMDKRECAKFQVEEDDILYLLRYGAPGTGRDYSHELFSSCKVEATVNYSDGTNVRLIVQSSGMARVIEEDGTERIIFHYPLWFDPMSGTYFNRG